MKVERVVLRKMRMTLKAPFKTSFGVDYHKDFILTELHAGGLVGYGEGVMDATPFYCSETVDTAWPIMERFLIPWLLEADWSHPAEVFPLFRQVRGHQMAKAALEVAAWDLWSKAEGIPLARALGGVKDRIAVGVSVGIQPTLEQTLEQIDGFLEQGYQRIKVKIEPGWDVQLVDAIRSRFGDIPLMADANSAYSLADLSVMKALDRYNLMMIEQPLAHDDIIDHVALQRELQTPICLDESIHSVADARKALAISACRIINIKIGRVGGLAQSQEIARLCEAQGVPVWCGGMLEAGVGRATNIAITSLSGFTLPGDTSASSRYWHEDIVAPAVKMVAPGWLAVPTTPGIGYEVVPELLEKYTGYLSSFPGKA